MDLAKYGEIFYLRLRNAVTIALYFFSGFDIDPF